MLHLLGVVLAASLGAAPVQGPAHPPRPRDLCLMHRACGHEPVFCTVHTDAHDCGPQRNVICFVAGCKERDPLPRAPGSSR